MDAAGYIYVAINPSMNGLLKIGKTTRDPELRVKELSRPSGVPTPFILIYKEYFDDCNEAEKVIHSVMGNEGYRVAENREFFNIPPEEALRIVNSIKYLIHSPTSPTSGLKINQFENNLSFTPDHMLEHAIAQLNAVHFVNAAMVKLEVTLSKGRLKIGDTLKLSSTENVFKGQVKQIVIEDLAETWRKVKIVTPGECRMIYVKGTVSDFNSFDNGILEKL